MKTFSNTDSTAIITDLTATNLSEAIVCGYIGNSDPANSSDGFVMRIDLEGLKLWEIILDGPDYQSFHKIITLSDNTFLACGYDGGPGAGSFFLMKLDISGNIIWRKDFRAPTTEQISIREIREDNNGFLYVLGNFPENQQSFNDRLLLMRFDRTGNQLYSKYFQPNNITSMLAPLDILIKDGSIYVCGFHLHNPINEVRGFLSKFDAVSGNINWTKVYDFNGGSSSFWQLFSYPGNRLLILGQETINATDKNSMIVCDTSGNVSSSRFFQYGDYRQFGSAAQMSNGSLIYGNYNATNTGVQLTISNIDPLTGVIWSKSYPQISGFHQVSKLHITPDSSLFFSGNQAPGQGVYNFVGKSNLSGEIGCSTLQLPVSFNNLSITPLNTDLFPAIKIFNEPVRPLPATSNRIDQELQLCSFSNYCDTLKMFGSDTLCSLNDTLTLSFYLNPACYQTPEIFFDPAYFQLIGYTSNIARLVPLQPGVTRIDARMITICDTLPDTLYIRIFDSPSQLNLGPDSSICPGNTRILNAHRGFVSYLWQDGSTDSTFTVTSPGTYWVETRTACNQIFSDTIIINAAAPPVFDIGPDMSKCNTDSLTITATPGFLNYTWKPDYNISSTTSQSVIVFPAIDTAYTVIAEKTPGCFAYDTIHINVNNSLPVYLGADTSFCTGDSLRLNAGSGFINYQWSNGSNSQIITVSNTGSYSIIATDANNCTSKDTLRVVNVFTAPVVNLPLDGPLCAGSNATLDAGNGFRTYNWSNGASSSSIAVNTIGTYWVDVTDNNGCKGTDTARITALVPLPSGFLQADTFICSYSTIQFAPASNFQSYLWYNGNTGKAIVISQPGTYWLQVTDNNDCVGRDTIILNPKQCLEGFYIPGAFTPNNDGKNDDYKPLLFGKVISYRFIIYNRWGQKVFESAESGKGWNGKFAGIDQSTNVFAWQCFYQFENKEAEYKKGTVLLIK